MFAVEYDDKIIENEKVKNIMVFDDKDKGL